MKQHDLLLLLCEKRPNVFVITISFKESAVHITSSKPTWCKTIPYDRYMKYSVNYLAKEILDEFSNSTAGKETLAVKGVP